MNLVADRFLFKRFINCPRKAVFDYNRNTFQSKRLLKSPATLEEFTHELFENTIIMLIQKKKKGERFTQKLIYDTFQGVYEHIKEKKFQKINQEIIDVYEANLEKILLAIKTSIEKNLLGISDLFTYKSFELKTTMHVDLKRIVENFFGEEKLQGTYTMSFEIPIVYKREDGFYVKIFSFDKGEILKNNPNVSMLFVLFRQMGLNLKCVQFYKPLEGKKEEIVSPGFMETDFIFYLKSILFSIEEQHILKNHRKENCFFCNHKELCANPKKMYKRNTFYNYKKPKVFYFDKRLGGNKAKEDFFKKDRKW